MQESPARVLNGKIVSRETAERLDHFIAIFMKWSATINLVAPSTIRDMWDRHIADSAQIHALSPKPASWVDLGSGGGFPGIITAILLAEQKDGWVHLIESNKKKAAFLRMAIQETGARASVHPIRIEEAPDVTGICARISSRALAELDLLLSYILPWTDLCPELRAYLHKGRGYQSEIEVSRRRWEFDLLKHESPVEQGSVILEISNLRPRQRVSG